MAFNQKSHPINSFGKPAPQGDGHSEKFKPSGSENKGGNAPRQDGKNSKTGKDNKAANWQMKHSLPGQKQA